MSNTLIEYTAVAKLVEDATAGVWDIAVVAFDPVRRNVLDFAPPHMVVDLTYLVAPGSNIRSAADADQPGVRIAAARGADTALFLERTLKAATVTPAANEPAANEPAAFEYVGSFVVAAKPISLPLPLITCSITDAPSG